MPPYRRAHGDGAHKCAHQPSSSSLTTCSREVARDRLLPAAMGDLLFVVVHGRSPDKSRSAISHRISARVRTSTRRRPPISQAWGRSRRSLADRRRGGADRTADIVERKRIFVEFGAPALGDVIMHRDTWFLRRMAGRCVRLRTWSLSQEALVVTILMSRHPVIHFGLPLDVRRSSRPTTHCRRLRAPCR